MKKKYEEFKAAIENLRAANAAVELAEQLCEEARQRFKDALSAYAIAYQLENKK